MRFASIITLVAALCAAHNASAATAVPKVLVSIKPLHSIVASVMGDTGTPELLLKGGASPHSYSLKPSDAEKIASADVIFWIGPALETFLERPLATLAPHARVLALSDAQGVLRLPARQGGLWEAEAEEHGLTGPATIDGHIWLDPRNAAIMARAIARTLGAADPARASQYATNAETFATRLQALDVELARTLAPIRSRPYIVFHDAFHYFELRYGLSPAGAVTVGADRPVGPRRIQDLHHKIMTTHAICVFSTPEFPPKMIGTLIEGTDAKVGVLDDLGADIPVGPAMYETLLRRLAGALAACLTPK